MSVYKNQSLLTIRLDTGRDLTGATVTRILYQKPDTTKGFWAATVVNDTEIEYELANGDIDIEGNWKLQSYVEIGGKKGYGELINQVFERNISA